MEAGRGEPEIVRCCSPCSFEGTRVDLSGVENARMQPTRGKKGEKDGEREREGWKGGGETTTRLVKGRE